jgi:glycerophosphoryl diester phosphodiesterase
MVLVSFDHQAMKRVKHLSPDVQTGLLFYGRQWTAQKMLKAVEETDADWLSLHASLVSLRVVAAADRAGCAVGVWTVNSKLLAKRLKTMGVTAIITDHPDKFKAAFDE